jgi:hypothetical protein
MGFSKKVVRCAEKLVRLPNLAGALGQLLDDLVLFLGTLSPKWMILAGSRRFFTENRAAAGAVARGLLYVSNWLVHPADKSDLLYLL